MTAMPKLPIVSVASIWDAKESLHTDHFDVLVSMTEPDGMVIPATTRHMVWAVPDRERESHRAWAMDAANEIIMAGAASHAEERVLFHCMAGHSRSPAAAILFLFGYLEGRGELNEDTARAAYDHVVNRYPTCLPNGSLLGAGERLLALDKMLTGWRAETASRTFIARHAAAEAEAAGEDVDMGSQMPAPDADLATGPVQTDIDDTLRDTLRDALAKALGSSAYDCTRVWEAWHVNTMSKNDFLPIAESNERLDECIDSILEALAKGLSPST